MYHNHENKSLTKVTAGMNKCITIQLTLYIKISVHNYVQVKKLIQEIADDTQSVNKRVKTVSRQNCLLGAQLSQLNLK